MFTHVKRPISRVFHEKCNLNGEIHIGKEENNDCGTGKVFAGGRTVNCTNCWFKLVFRFVFRFILRLILWLVLRLRVGGNIVALCVQTTCFGQGYVRQDVLEKETNVQTNII